MSGTSSRGLARSVRRRWCAALGSTALAAAVVCSASPAPAATPDVREQQWWIPVLGLEGVWKDHTRGKGVVVAVIDNGVHPGGDLEGALLPGFNQSGSGRGDVGSPDFHGTTMATEIAGRGTGQGVMGVAPEATILPVKIPQAKSAYDTVAALNTLAAMDDPPEVVSMSFSAPRACAPEEQQAVRAAIDAGMILVASMGNDRTGRETAAAPVGCAGVVAVGAYGYHGQTDDGPDIRMWPKSEQQPYAAFAAPGVRMIAFEPGSTAPVYFDGTSDAAAVAAGSFALIRAAFPDMPSRDLVARAIATARPLDGSTGTRSEEWGFGAIRAWAAIEEDVPAGAPNPIYDALDEVVPPTASSSPAPQPSPGAAATEPGATPTSPTASGETAEESSSTVVLLAGGAAVALVAAVLIVVLIRRRAGGSPPVG